MLVVAAFIIALGYGLIAPILPQFVVGFDVSFAAASAVVSIFAGARLLFAPMSGSLIDKIGSRRVYLTGLLTVAITTGLVALAQEYWQILLLRGIAGIGSTMFTVSAMGLIVKMAPVEIRGRCSSVYASSFLFGNIIGPVVGAAMSGLGMRWPFAIYGASVGLAALVCGGGCRKPTIHFGRLIAIVCRRCALLRQLRILPTARRCLVLLPMVGRTLVCVWRFFHCLPQLHLAMAELLRVLPWLRSPLEMLCVCNSRAISQIALAVNR